MLMTSKQCLLHNEGCACEVNVPGEATKVNNVYWACGTEMPWPFLITKAALQDAKCELSKDVHGRDTACMMLSLAFA